MNAQKAPRREMIDILLAARELFLSFAGFPGDLGKLAAEGKAWAQLRATSLARSMDRPFDEEARELVDRLQGELLEYRERMRRMANALLARG